MNPQTKMTIITSREDIFFMLGKLGVPFARKALKTNKNDIHNVSAKLIFIEKVKKMTTQNIKAVAIDRDKSQESRKN